MDSKPVTTYVLTFKSTAQHDAERRAGLNRFLKAALRSYKLRLVSMESKIENKCLKCGRSFLYCYESDICPQCFAQSSPTTDPHNGQTIKRKQSG